MSLPKAPGMLQNKIHFEALFKHRDAISFIKGPGIF